MFDQYIDWVEPWIVKALAIMFGSLLLVWIIGKVMDFLNGDRS
jgi:hypothetical protein